MFSLCLHLILKVERFIQKFIALPNEIQREKNLDNLIFSTEEDEEVLGERCNTGGGVLIFIYHSDD